MLEAILTRKQYSEEQVIGEMEVYDGRELLFRCVTLEQPWNNNKRNISCIPLGEYIVTKYSSQRYPDTFEVLDVPNRSYILIHWGNYYFNTEGCILVGEEVIDINNDGALDITRSKDTLDDFRSIVGTNDFNLTIVCACGC